MRRRSTRSSAGLVWPDGWRMCRSAGSRPGSVGGSRSPPFCSVPPTSGSSTSLTPASTPTDASAWTLWCARPRTRARRCCSPPTSSTGRAPSPRAWCPSPGARSAPTRVRGSSVLRDAAVMAGKDLRIEMRSRVTTNQVAPFALLVLVLFAFALDPDRGVLEGASAGLYWIAILFAGLLAIQRAFAVEAADGNRDALRMAGLEPAGIFLGKVAAISAELLALEALLGVGVAILYGTTFRTWGMVLLTCLVATLGLAAAGSLYGVLAAGLRVRETLLRSEERRVGKEGRCRCVV